MKKKMIALLLSIVLVAGSIGAVPVNAAEITEQAVVTAKESVKEEAEEEREEAALDIDDANMGASIDDDFEDVSESVRHQAISLTPYAARIAPVLCS